MKNRNLWLVLMLGVMLGQSTVPAAESPDPYANETAAQRDHRMEWWRAARFGMFIHWGVYSVPAGTYNGKKIDGIGEWIMHNGKIPMAEYQAYAKDFNPTNYNPDAWVRLAKAAGMKYIVITAKHHDGFALFDSKANDWNIVKATPYAKDLLKPLAEACRKHGVKLGFYYSQAQDWNNGGAMYGATWDKAQEHDMDDYIDKVAVPQMKELLSNYGKYPVVLWWDTPAKMNQERATKLIETLKLKPGIIHNNRLGGSYAGDTETPEQFIPATGYPGRDWETCMTMNDTWGFKSYDHNWKSTETIIRNLVDIASKGGNYLLNVGPTSDGVIPQPSIERLKEVGAWMKANGDAIYETSASPFKRLAWGRCTKKISGKETTLYLHVFNWPTDGKLVVPGLKNDVKSARLLNGPKLRFASQADGVTVSVPAAAPDKISSTIVLKIKGAPEVSAPVLTQNPDGSVTLPALDADLQGALQCESKDGKSNIGFWTASGDSVSWTFRLSQPAKFDIEAEIAAPEASAIRVCAGGQERGVDLRATGDYGKYETMKLGRLEFPAAGRQTLEVKPKADAWKAVNLRQIRLVPVKD